MTTWNDMPNDYEDALAEIERLRKAAMELGDTVARLRAALKQIVEIEPSYEYGAYSAEANVIATEALKE